MKILTVCDQGNNRSVHLAHLLKYWGNDCIPVGLKTNSKDTLEILFKWADLILLTEKVQSIPNDYKNKTRLLEIGPDIYPRPFNKDLNQIVRNLLEENKDLLKNN